MREIIKADHSAESIANVVSILILDGNPGLGFVECHNIQLIGTVAEKLEQYKKHTGRDWPGVDEQIYVMPNDKKEEFVSLNLGKQITAKRLLPCDIEAQRGIDALAAQAKRWIADNEIAKKQPRELQLQFLSQETA